MSVREIAKTRPGKLFLACYGAALLVFIGICIVGVIDREVAGAAAFAVLIAGPLIDASVVISWWAGRNCNRIARVGWIVLAVISLLSAEALLNAGNRDADVVMAYGVAALSFPLGLLAGPVAGARNVSSAAAATAVLWAIGVVAGYLQWFILIPVFIKVAAQDRQTGN